MGANNQQLRNDLNRDFIHVKQDIERLNIRIMLLEAENKRLREEIQQKENEDLKAQLIKKNSESQEILSLNKLRPVIEEIIGKALKVHNTKELSVFSAETQEEFAPIFSKRRNYELQEKKLFREKLIQQENKKDNFEENEQKPLLRRNAINETKSERINPIKDQLKSDLLKSYQRNRKNIIKQQILGEIQKGEYTKIALRDIIVTQKKYCSKASFYRYVEELELEKLIGQHRRKGKDIVIAKQNRNNLSLNENNLETEQMMR